MFRLIEVRGTSNSVMAKLTDGTFTRRLLVDGHHEMLATEDAARPEEDDLKGRGWAESIRAGHEPRQGVPSQERLQLDPVDALRSAMMDLLRSRRPPGRLAC